LITPQQNPNKQTLPGEEAIHNVAIKNLIYLLKKVIYPRERNGTNMYLPGLSVWVPGILRLAHIFVS